MWPWELKTIWGNGMAHTLEVAQWYVNTYPVRFTICVVGIVLVMCGLAIAAGLIARKLVVAPDPARHVFGNVRSADRKGLVK